MKRLLGKISMVLILATIMFMPIASFSGEISLPDYTITSLQNNAPKQMKALLGKWQGEWLGVSGIKSYLIVKDIDLKENKAWVIYTWSRNSSGSLKPGYIDVIASVTMDDGKTELSFGKRAVFNFILENGILKGDRSYKQYYSRIKMQKVK